MNIIINYDFFNAIRNVNEVFTGFKVIRNNKKKWIKYYLPTCGMIDYILLNRSPLGILPAMLLQANLAFGLEIIKCFANGGDIYRMKSEDDLEKLVSDLERINIETSYDLIKKSECYDRIVNLKINENKLPELIESKYILIPSYDYNGEITDTSVVQEHVIGSEEYQIFKGSPKKVLKLAYNKI